MPSIKAMACVQSAVAPAATATPTGIPCASTAKCILLSSPLLCGPCLGCPLGSRRVEVDFAMAGIDHQPFKIRLINPHFKEVFPYSLVSPPNKALVNGSPLPYSGGKSRHGASARNIQNTALMKRRLSFAIPPHCPLCPGRCGSNKAHAASETSWRR